ncbi:hypothetical protein BJV78DRAFT_1154966 [Lactifluus subvellereus]|nr:hypothetical protein BJV78DRAFT_1154966 [Lactifluus subvellereus]
MATLSFLRLESTRYAKIEHTQELGDSRILHTWRQSTPHLPMPNASATRMLPQNKRESRAQPTHRGATMEPDRQPSATGGKAERGARQKQKGVTTITLIITSSSPSSPSRKERRRKRTGTVGAFFSLEIYFTRRLRHYGVMRFLGMERVNSDRAAGGPNSVDDDGGDDSARRASESVSGEFSQMDEPSPRRTALSGGGNLAAYKCRGMNLVRTLAACRQSRTMGAIPLGGRGARRSRRVKGVENGEVCNNIDSIGELCMRNSPVSGSIGVNSAPSVPYKPDGQMAPLNGLSVIWTIGMQHQNE